MVGFFWDSLLCGVNHLSVSILYHQLRNHNQFVLNFHGLYFDQFGVACSLLFFQSAMKGILNNLSRPNTAAPGEALSTV